jgi:hypothetical protein
MEAKAQIEQQRIAADERMAEMKAQIELVKLHAKQAADESLERMKQQFELFELRLGHMHQRGMALEGHELGRQGAMHDAAIQQVMLPPPVPPSGGGPVSTASAPPAVEAPPPAVAPAQPLPDVDAHE